MQRHTYKAVYHFSTFLFWEASGILSLTNLDWFLLPGLSTPTSCKRIAYGLTIKLLVHHENSRTPQSPACEPA